MSFDAGRRARIDALLVPGRRVLLGLAGTPGSGKSTLASAIAEAYPSSVVVPMDGFHLANVVLERLGRLARKGAPDTFDIVGYATLLRRLREARSGETIYAPFFDRELDTAIAGAIPISSDVRLVISEGNYLLCDGACREVRALFDAIFYVESDEPARRHWLLARHIAHGRSREAAKAWIATVDEPNAALIRATRSLADLIVLPGQPS